MKVFCLFEQSGTFKNEFKKLGYEAYDYDIENQFSQTDFVIDLFDEIEKAYEDKKSIFDDIKEDDLIMAFYPCIRFEAQILLQFRGEAAHQKQDSTIKKLETDIKLHNELHKLYVDICKLCIVALKRNLKLIIENPNSSQHYLTRYWSIKPSLIDNDRSRRGDYFRKPTQYFFINCKPKANFVLEPITLQENIKKVESTNGIKRSVISKEYAERFIKEFII